MPFDMSVKQKITRIDYDRAVRPDTSRTSPAIRISLEYGSYGEESPFGPARWLGAIPPESAPTYTATRGDVEAFRMETGIDLNDEEDAFLTALYKFVEWARGRGVNI